MTDTTQRRDVLTSGTLRDVRSQRRARLEAWRNHQLTDRLTWSDHAFARPRVQYALAATLLTVLLLCRVSFVWSWAVAGVMWVILRGSSTWWFERLYRKGFYRRCIGLLDMYRETRGVPLQEAWKLWRALCYWGMGKCEKTKECLASLDLKRVPRSCQDTLVWLHMCIALENGDYGSVRVCLKELEVGEAGRAEVAALPGLLDALVALDDGDPERALSILAASRYVAEDFLSVFYACLEVAALLALKRDLDRAAELAESALGSLHTGDSLVPRVALWGASVAIARNDDVDGVLAELAILDDCSELLGQETEGVRQLLLARAANRLGDPGRARRHLLVARELIHLTRSLRSVDELDAEVRSEASTGVGKSSRHVLGDGPQEEPSPG